jgi:DNA replication initiation complex subunit (GINS family)
LSFLSCRTGLETQNRKPASKTGRAFSEQIAWERMLNYSELRDIQRKEMESSAIVNLPDDFYRSVSQLLTKKKNEAFDSKSLLAIKEFENIRKIILTIQAKREEKIVLMAVRGEREGSGLTSEEKEMLKELSSIVNRSRENVKSAWDNENAISNQSRRIKILKDVSQYRGLDSLLYGPFKQGEEQMLPRAEAEWLLKAGMAEII